ncbi:hypothetical protein TWF569_008177 [Orbilia oligospora]|uniref:Uncharacterized protein n=1 Tax=Orbilia oligospora TaxID=2813651 RepID=A0A7C8NPP9_ORBOL|nr:hypothetical protein TWF102_002068 [Orbilia oligospora]KAF3086629.1 hypothetical protein TWF706_011373 [Orbilia oligospora]KAF3123573.1 hypothetical protein TWF594_002406 [Orbilia oligospora]KAF3129653.1 hypothetical protein TWF703_008761 [Orbilia oligospora]KAF3140864.1 hypothetical protein TWF569_008177 [Orbilia oligospora]
MASKRPPEPKYRPEPELVIMASRAQQLHEPLKLTTLIRADEASFNMLGIHTLRIPRGFPTSINLKKLTLEFHGYVAVPNVHYSIDIISSPPRGVVDGFTSAATALERLNQIYDLGHTKLNKGNEWFSNDTNVLHFISLTAPVQRGIKLFARINGKFVDNNEAAPATNTTGTTTTTGGAPANPAAAPLPPPQITTVDDEFVIVLRFLCLSTGNIGHVTGVVGLEIS